MSAVVNDIVVAWGSWSQLALSGRYQKRWMTGECREGIYFRDQNLSIRTEDDQTYGQKSDDLEPSHSARHHMSTFDVPGQGFGQSQTENH
jgi:hypothetical protein